MNDSSCFPSNFRHRTGRWGYAALFRRPQFIAGMFTEMTAAEASGPRTEFPQAGAGREFHSIIRSRIVCSV
jgi:hypothetical protein